MIAYTSLAIVVCICLTYLLSLYITRRCKHKYVYESKSSVERRKEGTLGAYENRFYSVECHLSRCEHCGNLKKTFVQ